VLWGSGYVCFGVGSMSRVTESGHDLGLVIFRLWG